MRKCIFLIVAMRVQGPAYAIWNDGHKCPGDTIWIEAGESGECVEPEIIGVSGGTPPLDCPGGTIEVDDHCEIVWADPPEGGGGASSGEDGGGGGEKPWKYCAGDAGKNCEWSYMANLPDFAHVANEKVELALNAEIFSLGAGAETTVSYAYGGSTGVGTVLGNLRQTLVTKCAEAHHQCEGDFDCGGE
jgi:hypothetical protein